MCNEHSQYEAAETRCLTVDEYTCAACRAPLSVQQVAEIVDGGGLRCSICDYVCVVCEECEIERPVLVASTDRHFADHCTDCAKADLDARHDNTRFPRQTLPARSAR